MSNFIENSNRAPELVESNLKSLITPAANFIATLTAGAGLTVELLGDDEVNYGTFTLTALNVPVSSGLLTAFPARMRFRVTAGMGSFNIKVVITP